MRAVLAGPPTDVATGQAAAARPARRGSYLLLWDFERLEEWARLVTTLFDGECPYLVGSVNERADFRDVDLRLILSDRRYDSLFRGAPERVRMLNRAISAWGQRDTGLPVDFQVQRQTEANAQYPHGFRNPMGIRDWHLQGPPGVPRR